MQTAVSIAGIALGLPAFGVTAYALPVVVNIATGPMDTRLVNGLYYNPLPAIFVLAFLLCSVGAVLFGVAVWRSGSLPKWAGVLYAVHAPLLWAGILAVLNSSSAPLSVLHILSTLGTVLLVLGGGWIALSIFRGPSAGEMGAEAEPRVRS